MFTGIIEETGAIVSVRKGQKDYRLSIRGSVIFEDIKEGDSIAVNGVCLTVSGLDIDKKIFSADVMNETISRSALGQMKPGAQVNLERAMPAYGRFGGHIVSGHIDGIGTISSKREDDNAVWFTVHTTRKLLRYIVEKGSIAIDGISLTIAGVYGDYFEVSVIPHTAKATTLISKNIGAEVNLENDVVGKYIEKFLMEGVPALNKTSNITAEFLAKNGF